MHSFVLAAIGGTLIGVAAILMMWLIGRIAGISGILSGVFTETHGDRLWRLLFAIGLVLGGAVPSTLLGLEAPLPPAAPMPLVVAAGLLVGLGTGLGSGCTSGHGICGMARLSKRSLVATAMFMATGIATVFVLRHVVGG